MSQTQEMNSPSDSRPRVPRIRWLIGGVVLMVIALVVYLSVDFNRVVAVDAVATYVGRGSCVECHQPQATSHLGSHHDLAMAPANSETVLGDFENSEMTHHGIVSRMFRQDDKFMIHTEGPDGQMADFEIKYVFGVTPLQQYMVEFDRTPDMKTNEIGRVQVLRISWDTNKKQWFYLPPPDVPERLEPDDPLHWTGIAQRWNTMCADCHSTNVHKGFNVETGNYHTTFSEIDVSCEACHGPGSIHVQLAKRKSLFWDRDRGTAITAFKKLSPKVEIETCAPCHSRRSVVDPHFRPEAGFYNHYVSELLDSSTYFADGQILDEVYVYGSFTQSKMFHKDIRCTDCHDPHTAKLKHSGNKVCTSCHQHPEGKYDTPAHHHHQSGSTGSRCVECHIPETTYMEVDPRRDHSFRVPRPDLSLKLGLPNACSRCHLDRAVLPTEKKSEFKQYRDWVVAAERGDSQVAESLNELDQWCFDAFKKWYPNWKPEPSFADYLTRARRQDGTVLPELIQQAGTRKFSEIARATLMLEAMRLIPDVDPYRRLPAGEVSAFFELTGRWLEDRNPQLKVAAIRAYELRIPIVGSRRLDPQAAVAMAPQLRRVIRALIPLLDDSMRSVRIETARVLQRLPPELRPELLNTPQRERLAEVTQELMAVYDANSDRAGSHVSRALLFESMGRDEDAMLAYRIAARIEPKTPGARSNLATLIDRMAETKQAEAMPLARSGQRELAIESLKQADELRTEAAELRKAELPLLARDAALAPDNAPVQYRYGLALYLAGDPKGAEVKIRRAAELEPQVEQYTLTLATFYRDFGRPREAMTLINRLLLQDPQNQTYQAMKVEIQTQINEDTKPAPAPDRN